MLLMIMQRIVITSKRLLRLLLHKSIGVVQRRMATWMAADGRSVTGGTSNGFTDPPVAAMIAAEDPESGTPITSQRTNEQRPTEPQWHEINTPI